MQQPCCEPYLWSVGATELELIGTAPAVWTVFDAGTISASPVGEVSTGSSQVALKASWNQNPITMLTHTFSLIQITRQNDIKSLKRLFPKPMCALTYALASLHDIPFPQPLSAWQFMLTHVVVFKVKGPGFESCLRHRHFLRTSNMNEWITLFPGTCALELITFNKTI